MLGIGGYIIVLLLVVLGARLLVLAVRTRQLPELWLFFLSTAPGAWLMLGVLERFKHGVVAMSGWCSSACRSSHLGRSAATCLRAPPFVPVSAGRRGWRRVLGLGDPAVANRFLLFAVWLGWTRSTCAETSSSSSSNASFWLS